MDHPDNLDSREPRLSLAKLLSLTAALTLAGGILLDLNRINAVRDTLDRVAQVAAIEAAASTRPAERTHICRKRFDRHVWTETEVSVDTIDVSIGEDKQGRRATVEYDATVKLVVGRYFGLPEVEISGEVDVSAPTRNAVAAAP
ncbi:MAG: hypothetical protein ACRCWF_14190 [Beijerinckiaceae bacterium]